MSLIFGAKRKLRVAWEYVLSALILFVFAAGCATAMWACFTFIGGASVAIAWVMIPLGAATLAGFVVVVCRICIEQDDDDDGETDPLNP